LLALGWLSFGTPSQAAPDRNNPPSAEARAYGDEPYRLGAGDVLSIQLYGLPETLRPEVTVAPDGTLSYLSAVGLEVRGQTIMDARRRLEEALAAHYRKPQVIISPVGLVSKSYTIMGMVKRTGIFPMPQPVTLIEALSRAGGTVSGLFDRRYVDLADLQRSFLLRNGRRMPVNFYKLMVEGDMSHNIPLEPGDYIQVASALANDYYVLGAVKKPGREGFTEGASVMSAIAKRLGFEGTSYREHVLVVRGSMSEPETFVINTDAILKGERPDFLLEPKDIVYVSNRPWHKVEEVLDNAVGSFLEASTAVWTGANAPVLFRDAVLPTTIYNTNNY
jgi:protein involved in polysaccharide export with SLBB domain